ncbi:YeeE/YedE family protein [Haloarchaeobius sp. DYHT-AS-18]|uniref:YeeE/YedE family protein n=1 Tax=Haloarchaeobius sp. DYHT-AS-18 TaxID=3446117 RepID=UPI003EBEFAAB
MSQDRGLAFYGLVLLGGLIFGVGLALSEMARPEVVLRFLQLEDFGLLLVMGGASVTAGIAFWTMSRSGRRAPLTGAEYTRRLKDYDNNVLVGGTIFGVGWGLSGICPGAAYASLGVGNLTILWGIGGMFLGAYVQGVWRSRDDDPSTTPSSAD